jgi:DNA polymerase III subunit delta'
MMWQNIVGHTEQITNLRRTTDDDMLAQAYLFAGPSGVGKRHIAIALAQQILGTSAERIATGAHPDVIHVVPDPEKAMRTISVEQIRQLQSQLHLHAMEGTHKFAIIDDADCMHPAAANACLKILEEPPSATHFFLISAKQHRLLPTIRSRCQMVHFGPLDSTTVAQYLESQGIDSAEARQRAIMSEGSIGHAASYPAEVITETMTALHQLLTEKKQAHILDLAEIWSADTDLLPRRLQLVGTLWRDAMAYQAGATEKPSLPATTSLVELLSARSPRRLAQEMAAALQAAQEAQDTTLNKQLSCESLLFRLSV